MERWEGDGIIARVQNQVIVEEVLATGIPTVDVLGVVPNRFPLVHVNDVMIAEMAAEHLLERGFRNFGFFGISGENWSVRRRDSFIEAVRKEDGKVDVYELPRRSPQENNWETMENDLAAWIGKLPKPAGLMICSDQRGPQLLEACRRAGVQVPDEIAVIGVDNDEPLCEVCDPPLSSVSAGHAQVGYSAAGLLFEQMKGSKHQAENILVDPKGVVTRLSTDVLAIQDRKLAMVLRIIRENACHGLEVDELARIAGLSRSVLQRRFRMALKRSIHQEIIAVKLKRAQELLSQTELSLVDIAEKAGFKHQEYMGAVFRARLGKTPAQYRRAINRL
jgi:LacI family transcriptional regulator